MDNLNKKGYCIIKGFFEKEDILQFREQTFASFIQENSSKIINNSFPLEQAHKFIERNDVPYLSMSYGNKTLSSTIEKIAEKRLNKIRKNYGEIPLKVNAGSSVISIYPYKLFEYRVGFHQDDGYAEGKDNTIHALTPLTPQRFDLFQVIERTHKIGTFKHTMFGPLLRIPDKELEDYKTQIVDLKLEVGDILLFYTPLIHRLRENHSKLTNWLARFTFNLQN